MDRVRKLTGAEPLLAKGFTGKGITAAILDSGIYPHPDLKERIVDFRDFLNGRTGCYDDYGHGTHVAGILAGNGKLSRGRYRGIAPECRLLPVKVLDRRGNGSRQDVLRGIEFVISTRERYHTRILNISVGTLAEGKDDEELIQAVEDAWDAGLIVVAAAGNMGPRKESIPSPGSSRKIITVGASDDEQIEAFPRKGRILTGYSGRGPTCACIVKPELTAPGTGIVSCSSRYAFTRQGYTVKSGTSMSTPVVSGAAALLLSLHPEFSNLDVKMRMHESTVDLKLPGSRQGWGFLRIDRLLR